jgi:2-polyprenyl-3-methyl-5-hydroxy-6-metoxy-1,4-benzoquinol methylase
LEEKGAKGIEDKMDKLKLLWLEPQVQFKGRGIITAWREEMERQGWEFTNILDNADLIFFGSDSMLDQNLLGKKPTILYFWGWLPSRLLNKQFQKFASEQLRLMAQCTRILTPGPIVTDQVACFGLPSQVCIPGVDIKLIDSHKIVPVREPRVMFLSRLAEHKGLDLLIQAMSMIDPQPSFIICGSGTHEAERYYKDMAVSLGVKVDFLDPDDEEKILYLKTSSVLVHPSYYEGLGLPPLEALACGTPVIAMGIPQMRWLLQEDAYFFDSIEGLAKQIIHVHTFQGEAYDKAAAGNERVRRSFTLEHASQRLWAHIHQVIKEHLGVEVRQHPDQMGSLYNIEHRRNWNYSVDRFDPTWSRHWRAQTVIEALKKCGAQHVLDVGCGAVYPTIFARAGFQVTAVDISDECMKQVMTIAEKWKVADKIIGVVEDATKLKFEDASFDAVVQGELWEHVPNVNKVIDEGLRVLKPGGYLIASTPVGTHHFDPMHITIFDDASINELLKPYSTIRLDKIAEEGADPSCYFIIIQKEGGTINANQTA